MSNRIIKSISFSKENPHEMELFNFAVKQDKYLGKYIKRLIDRDKREKEHGAIAIPSSPSITNAKRESDQDSEAASDFL